MKIKRDFVKLVKEYLKKGETIGPFMPRKSTDVTINDSDVPLSFTDPVREISDRLLESAKSRYEDEIPSKEALEWDRFWMREYAALSFYLSQVNGETYEEYLPGKFLNYKRLIDALEHHLGDLTGKKIVEVGGGSGIGLVIAATRKAEVHNIDHSIGALMFFEYLAKLYGVKEKISTKRTGFYSTGYEDEEFDAVYNVGVVEHLNENDEKRLTNEMKRITRRGGLVMIAVPNIKSPLYQATHQKEKEIFGKKGYKEMYLLPDWPKTRDVDLENLMSYMDLELLDHDAVLLVPSSKDFYRKPGKEIAKFYESFPKVMPVGEGRKFIRNLIGCGEIIEKLASKEERLKYGWFEYSIGRKPKPAS